MGAEGVPDFPIIDVKTYSEAEATEVGLEYRRLSAGNNPHVQFAVARHVLMIDTDDRA
jgi:hypothetical protein